MSFRPDSNFISKVKQGGDERATKAVHTTRSERGSQRSVTDEMELE